MRGRWAATTIILLFSDDGSVVMWLYGEREIQRRWRKPEGELQCTPLLHMCYTDDMWPSATIHYDAYEIPVLSQRVGPPRHYTLRDILMGMPVHLLWKCLMFSEKCSLTILHYDDALVREDWEERLCRGVWLWCSTVIPVILCEGGGGIGGGSGEETYIVWCILLFCDLRAVPGWCSVCWWMILLPSLGCCSAVWLVVYLCRDACWCWSICWSVAVILLEKWWGCSSVAWLFIDDLLLGEHDIILFCHMEKYLFYHYWTWEEVYLYGELWWWEKYCDDDGGIYVWCIRWYCCDIVVTVFRMMIHLKYTPGIHWWDIERTYTLQWKAAVGYDWREVEEIVLVIYDHWLWLCIVDLLLYTTCCLLCSLEIYTVDLEWTGEVITLGITFSGGSRMLMTILESTFCMSVI